MMNDTITKRKCPSCGKPKILSDENTGELFCGSCGFVITDKIEDTGAEWRSFSQDEGNRARTGAALLLCTTWDYQLLLVV
jgi:transcription initiation factor TFIIB